MTPNIEASVVPLQERHVRAVARIERRVFPDPWSESLVRAELDNALSRWFVLESGREVLGYVAVMNIAGEVHVTNVAVVPEYRRRGLARLLLSRAIAYARAAGAFCMTLEVRESNTPAIALYRSFGFVPVGLRPRYYQDPQESALLMTLLLSEEDA